MSRTALIIVDVQNDFLPEGAKRPPGSLAVPNGDQVIPVISALLNGRWDWDLIVATQSLDHAGSHTEIRSVKTEGQDYHPPDHISFASRHSKEPFSTLQVTDARGRTYEQTLWPDHCVQGTKGAEIDKGLRDAFESWKSKMKLVRKACQCDIEAYSAFEGYVTEATGPAEPPGEVTEGEMLNMLKDAGIGRVLVTGLATDFCVKETTLDALRAGLRTAVLAPSVRGVYEDASKAALEEIKAKGGVVLGEGDESDWEGSVRDWLAGQ